MITVITPTTHNREAFNERIKFIFANQTVQCEHLFDYDAGTIGEKLNRLCRKAHGDIIVRADSDDVYAFDWVEKVSAVLGENDIIGLSAGYFHNVHTNSIYEYQTPKGKPMFLMGATLCFHKRVWQSRLFRNVNQGEEHNFIHGRKIADCGYKDGFMASLHGTNTASHLSIHGLKKLPQNEAAAILKRWYPTLVP